MIEYSKMNKEDKHHIDVFVTSLHKLVTKYPGHEFDWYIKKYNEETAEKRKQEQESLK